MTETTATPAPAVLSALKDLLGMHDGQSFADEEG